MFVTVKRQVCIFLVLSIVFVSSWSAGWAQDDTGKSKLEKDANPVTITIDVLIVRPIGIALIPVTAVICLLALPYTIPQGNTGEVFDKLVGETARYTFKRPIGHKTPFD